MGFGVWGFGGLGFWVWGFRGLGYWGLGVWGPSPNSSKALSQSAVGGGSVQRPQAADAGHLPRGLKGFTRVRVVGRFPIRLSAWDEASCVNPAEEILTNLGSRLTHYFAGPLCLEPTMTTMRFSNRAEGVLVSSFSFKVPVCGLRLKHEPQTCSRKPRKALDRHIVSGLRSVEANSFTKPLPQRHRRAEHSTLSSGSSSQEPDGSLATLRVHESDAVEPKP